MASQVPIFVGDLAGEAETQPEPCTAMLVNITSVQGGSPTPRSPIHQAPLLGARAPEPNDLLPCNTTGPLSARNQQGRGPAAAREGQGTCGQCTRWRASCSTCSGRLPVIMQRQVPQSCTNPVIDVGVVPQIQFIHRVFLPRCEQRQVPTVSRFFSRVVGALQRQGRRCASGVPRFSCSTRLLEEFHIFSACLRRLPGIWTLLSTSALYLAATCPCALRQSTETFGQITSFFHVKVDSELPAQFSPWKSGHYFHLQSYGGECFFSAALTHLSRSSRSSGVERQFLEPSITC